MITIADVNEAQQAWGEGIVTISSAYNSDEDYVEKARKHIQSLYAYDTGPVLFKPTFASKEQFRSTFEGALSYFVASNGECPEDTGFAIKNWISVRFENDDIVIRGETAMAMGNYYFVKPNGEEVKAEFSFGYIIDEHGKLRIHLHHSSMPVSLGS